MKARINSRLLGTSRATLRHGCATLYKWSRFDFVTKKEVRLLGIAKQLSMETREYRNISKDFTLLKDNVALITILTYLEKQRGIAVVNTHIYGGEYKDVTLLQVGMLLHTINEMVVKSMPILLCGDFNSKPESASFDLIVKEKISEAHKDFPIDRTGILGQIPLFHRLPLEYTYFHLPDRNPLTYFRDDGPGETYDYIFHTALEVTKMKRKRKKEWLVHFRSNSIRINNLSKLILGTIGIDK